MNAVHPAIAIVTDSTADLPADIAAAHDIQVVPAILVMEGKSMEDGPGIARQTFYERLPILHVLPTTSAPSTGTFLRVYEKLFQQGFVQIISIHVASPLSGIFNAARLAAESFDDCVHVFDSGQLSLGLGFQVLAAAESAVKGLPLDSILAVMQAMQPRIHVVAMLDTLEYVRRSGRVSWARASIGALLSLKPFVGLKNGEVLRFGETRTRRKGIERLLDMLYAIGPLERLAILHTNAETEAQQILEGLTMALASAPMLVNVTTVIGAHLGPNALGFAAVAAEG